MTRVLVVGGGVAGLTAALAAREAGAEVAIVSRGPGASALVSGAVEVAPGGGPPVEAARALADRLPGHPYARLRDRLGELPGALSLLRRSLSPHLSEEGGRFVTPLGGVRPAALAQVSQAAGAIRAGERIAVAGFRHHPGLSASERIAERLAGEGIAASSVTLDWLDRVERLGWTIFELARLLDDPAEAARLGESIRRAKPQADRVLLPAFVGIERPEQSLKLVSEAAGVACGERLAGLPTLPGLRLRRAMDRALGAPELHPVAGEVVELRDGHARVDRESGEEELRFDVAVLASGKYVGGGIRCGRSFVEPLGGLPVHDGQGELNGRAPERLLADAPCGPCPAFEAGVRIDGSSRPLDATGAPVAWLRAAGAVLAGSDFAADGAGLGLAAFTGYLAGRSAAAGRG